MSGLFSKFSQKVNEKLLARRQRINDKTVKRNQVAGTSPFACFACGLVTYFIAREPKPFRPVIKKLTCAGCGVQVLLKFVAHSRKGERTYDIGMDINDIPPDAQKLIASRGKKK